MDSYNSQYKARIEALTAASEERGNLMLFSEMLECGRGGATAIVDSQGSITYGEFRAAIAGFAAHLRDMGLAKGDRVALWGYNSANWLVAFFAIVRAGGVALLVNYSTGIDDAAALLQKSNARFLICGDNGQTKRREDAMEALASAAGIEHSRCVDARESSYDLVGAYAKAEGLAEQRQFRIDCLACDDVTAIVDALEQAFAAHGLAVERKPETRFSLPTAAWREGVEAPGASC